MKKVPTSPGATTLPTQDQQTHLPAARKSSKLAGQPSARADVSAQTRDESTQPQFGVVNAFKQPKAEAHLSGAEHAALSPHVNPRSVSVIPLSTLGELKVVYEDKSGNKYGPYIIALRPTLPADKVDAVADTLINLIELTRKNHPTFTQVSFVPTQPAGKIEGMTVWDTASNGKGRYVKLDKDSLSDEQAANKHEDGARLRRCLAFLRRTLQTKSAALSITASA